MIVYKAENRINGMVYVGQTVQSLETRISRHLSYGDSFFPRALRHYGRSAFEFSIIDRAKTKDELDAKECYWIGFYGCMAPVGYNLTEGGGGAVGWKATPEMRAKVSKAKLGKSNMTAEGKARLREYRLNNPMSAEARAKMSESGKTRGFTEEHRKNLSKANRQRVPVSGMLGKTHSEETKAKLRASRLAHMARVREEAA